MEGELQGVWQAVSVVVSGQRIDDSDVKSIRLTLSGDRFTTRRGGETLFDSSYSADAKRGEIEMIGSGGDFEGKPARGIYEFEEELLRLCYAMPGFARPSAFKSEAGSGVFLIELRRVEE